MSLLAFVPCRRPTAGREDRPAREAAGTGVAASRGPPAAAVPTTPAEQPHPPVPPGFPGFPIGGDMRLFSKPRKRALRGGVILAAVALTAAACGSGGGGGTSTAHNSSNSSAPRQGGSLTVLEWTGFAGDWPAGLDPATNTNGAADQSQMDAIFGQLFELGAGGKIMPDLAT